MKFWQLRVFVATALLAGLNAVQSDAAIVITTGLGTGADAEVREESPDTNRGSNTELATQVPNVLDGSGNNRVMYTKFDVSNLNPQALNGEITFRLTFRNTNMTDGRIRDTSNNTGERTGLDYYVLDPTHAGANWGELALTYNNAPGLLAESPRSRATKDYDTSAGSLTYLGRQLFRALNNENRLPVGEAHDFTVAPGSPLHSAIGTALGTSHKTVTLVSGIQHPAAYSNPLLVSNWLNFNYLFNPKEQTVLTNDNTYDNDVSAADGNEGSPYACQASGSNLCGGVNKPGDNSLAAGSPFAPQLVFAVPEPSSLLLVGLGGLAMIRGVRRRQ